MSTFSDLMHGFANRVGIDDFSPGQDGVCSFLFDEATVSFREEAESDSLLIYGLVGEVPGAGQEALFRLLLNANASYAETRGAFLSLWGNAIILQRRVALAGLDANAFYLITEEFIKTLDAWIDTILRGASEDGAQRPHEVSNLFLGGALV